MRENQQYDRVIDPEFPEIIELTTNQQQYDMWLVVPENS